MRTIRWRASLATILLIVVGLVGVKAVQAQDVSPLLQAAEAQQAVIMPTSTEEHDEALESLLPAERQALLAMAKVGIDGVLNPSLHHHDSIAPEDGPQSVGVGTEWNQYAIVVGVNITHTRGGLSIAGSGCEQILISPDNYLRDLTITDGSYWVYNMPSLEPSYKWPSWAAILSYQWAEQQENDEDCPKLSDEERLDHILVWTEEGATNFRDWRYASGENRTIMFPPGSRVVGWHMGLGNSQDNLCGDGGCLLESAPTWGWCGGCAVSYWLDGEADGFVPIPQNKINAVLLTLDE